MKNSFSLSKTALAVACGSLLALSAHAQSQSDNDSATVEITGQISPTTCILKMANAAGGPATNLPFELDWGNVKSETTGITPGKTFGIAKTVVFTLGSAANSTTPCTAGGNSTNSGWNVILGFEPGTLGKTSDGKTYVANQAKGGTNAWMALSDATTSTVSPLTLKETMGYTGTTVTATNVGFSQSITLQAQLAYSGNAAATAGAYSATIPLLVLYK